MARTPARGAAGELIQEIRTEPRAKIVFVDEPLLDRAVSRYVRSKDKTWGLVDCASFVVMETTGCREAFSHDHHFEQAGFATMLKLG